jgi:DNA polymerase
MRMCRFVIDDLPQFVKAASHNTTEGRNLPILFRDYETRSTLDLKRVGARQYATHGSTNVWCCAYAVDDEAVKLWVPGEPVPAEFITAAENPDWLISAFNDGFERAIEQHIMAPRYGWPLVPIERHRCSQAAAAVLALPAALKDVAQALHLEHQKDETGRDLMMRMARPRRPRSDEAPGIYWFDDPERRERLGAYCRQDVETERAVYRRIPPLTADEQSLWVLDAKINDRGIYLDGNLIDAAIKIAEAAQDELATEIHKITGGAVSSVNQTEKLIAWLADHGCPVDDVQKGTLRKALTRNDLAPTTRRVIELRLDGAHAAAKKLNTMRSWRAEDGRVRGALKYHGASTGRWTSYGIQFQNMKRPSVEDMGAAIAAVSTGSLEHLREHYPQPMSVVGDISRAIIAAAPGHRFIAADLSGIESRVTAWVSGQQSKLDQWAKFDRTQDPNDEPYTILGRQLGVPEDQARAIGKTADLAFGYMGSVGAWRKLAATRQGKSRFKPTRKAGAACTQTQWRSGASSRAPQSAL